MAALHLPSLCPTEDVSGCTVVGATITLASGSTPVSPLWISSHISPVTHLSPITHVPLDHLWTSPPLPRLSPTKSPCTDNHFDVFRVKDKCFSGFKEKYLR